MTPHYQGQGVTLWHGDCIEVMRPLPDNSVDSVVTDPPYGLGFMGKDWDDLPPGLPWARECLRVLKPGGHLLAFGGTRTWHRLAVAVEDAGFEVRDSLAWLYGSGFPKSLDVSKAIDKQDAADERLSRAREFQAWLRQHVTAQQVNAATDTEMGHHLTTHPTQPAVATADLFDRLRPLLPEVPERIEALVAQRMVESQNYKAREVVGSKTLPDSSKVRLGFVGEGYNGDAAGAVRDVPITDAHTEAAKQWQGWGTALKPAFEPVVVARKPLAGTVAANVLAHGTGALNIDGCRVGNGPRGGRWPANVLLDGSQADALDEQSGNVGDTGGASRFFPTFRYKAKAPTRERPRADDGTAHPTVKPLELMRWLVRLVTPPGGTVLEPFAGSGTTAEACALEGFRCLAIEREAIYLPLIVQRLNRPAPAPKDKPAPRMKLPPTVQQPDLFEEDIA